jgi:biopolymer transport protein TolR
MQNSASADVVSSALSAAQRSKIRRLSEPEATSPSDEGGELNIVPYLDIIMNILMFVLATVAVVFVSNIDATAPPSNGIRVDGSSLRMTVLITNQGFAIKTAAGNLAPGCQSIGPGTTLPKLGDDYDLDALTACARRIKAAASRELGLDDHVTVTASPGIEYGRVLQALDALRADREGKLFPEVAFGVAR